MNKQTAWGSCHSELTSWPLSAPRPPGGHRSQAGGVGEGCLGGQRGGKRGQGGPQLPGLSWATALTIILQLEGVWPEVPKPICTRMLSCVSLASLGLTKGTQHRQARLWVGDSQAGAGSPEAEAGLRWGWRSGMCARVVGEVSPPSRCLVCAADAGTQGGCVHGVCCTWYTCGVWCIQECVSTSGLVALSHLCVHFEFVSATLRL